MQRWQQRYHQVDVWWNEMLACLSDGDGARVAALLAMPVDEFFEAIRVWRAHMKQQQKAMKNK